MTAEHNWSLPSISLHFGKNSTSEVINRGKIKPTNT